MLTGRAPFEGDSAVAVALKHVSQPVPPVRELRTDVPPALEAVVMKALAKDPAERYAEADSFIRDLEAAKASLSQDADGGNTAAFAPVPVPLPPQPSQGPPSGPPPVPPEPVPPGEERRPRRVRLVLLALLAVAALALAGYLLTRPQQSAVPNVVGKQLDPARSELEAEGFEVDIDRRPDQSPFDTVFRQVPTAGNKVDDGSTVTLFVSNGPSTVEVPDVVGLTQEDASRRIRRADLRPRTQRESSTRVPAGNVIRTDPGPGATIERGSRVTLLVSSGAKQVTVPDVTGQDETDAAASLRERGLSPFLRERDSSEPVDTVLEQSPEAGQLVDEGSTVTLYVSNGKLEEVPDVVGLSQGEAEGELRSAGFRASVRTQEVDEPDRDGTVVSQTPSGGRERTRGATVTITVGTFTAPEPPPAAAPGTEG
jgi:serine/threonine-protein kinase